MSMNSYKVAGQRDNSIVRYPRFTMSVQPYREIRKPSSSTCSPQLMNPCSHTITCVIPSHLSSSASLRQKSIPKPSLRLLFSTIFSRSLWNWVKGSVSRLDKSESSSTMIISRPTSYSTTAFYIAISSWI